MKKIFNIEKCFYIIFFLTFLIGLYLFIISPFKTSISSILTLIISLLILISLAILLFIFNNMKNNNNFLQKKRNKKIYIIIFIILIFISFFQLIIFFLCSSRYNYHYKNLWKDKYLYKYDKNLLGWLFKDGQLSLTLDKSKILNPNTIFHKIIASILQICYFCYYLIPYVFIYIINIGKIIYFHFKVNDYKMKKIKIKIIKYEFIYLLNIYILTYSQVIFINTLVPSISPRLYLKYKNSLKFLGLAEFINKTFQDNNSANSFPSGHVAETICVALGFFGLKKKKVGIFLLIMSLLIMLSTLFLRYHYFVDVVMGNIVSFISFFIVNYIEKTDNFINKNNEIDDIENANLFINKILDENELTNISV